MTLAEMAEAMESPQSEVDRFGDKTSYMVASAGEALRKGQALGADVLVLDPPRKGLEEDVLTELCKPVNPHQEYVEHDSQLFMEEEKVNWTNDLKTIVYVSCGFEALARDAELLLRSRAGWKLKSATGYLLFPGSDHVESICVFERK